MPLDLKSTLNLPKTDFPMKANLPQNEPKMLAHWEKVRIYDKIRESRHGSPIYVLHDGPPYANGPIHLGHALNKCLKDFIVKSRSMAGFDSPYVPGWDCHGLPIEIKVDESLGRKKLEMDPLQVREACRKYAEKYLNLQREQFKRLGVFGEWEEPYVTMNPQYESHVIENFYAFFEKDMVYKGLKPVYWCIHDETALAEAEVEYGDHTSPSIWVRYPLTSDPAALDAALAGKKVATIIWTTTPWTLPASMAVAFHPSEEYVALAAGEWTYIVARKLAEETARKCELGETRVIASMPGSKLERSTFAHPFLERSILGVLADYVTMDQGTGAVHTAPSHGADDFYTGVEYGIDQTCNVDESGRLRNGLPEYDGLTVFKANEPVIELLKKRGALLHRENIEHSYPHCWRCHNPVIFRATEQWFISMEGKVNGASKPGTLRSVALDEISKVKWDPAWGEERISNMIATRPDWCISRQRVWGVPIAVFFCQGCGEVLKSKAANRAVIDLFAREGADSWYRRKPEEILPAGTKCAKCGGTSFKQEMDIIDVWFESGLEPGGSARPFPRSALALRSVSRRRRSASRLVPLFPAVRRRAARPCALSRRCHQWLDARRAGASHVQVARQRGRSGRHLQAPGRGGRPPVGGLGGLPRRRARLGKPGAARGGKLPQDPQHLPLPARQPRRLRSPARPGAV